MSEHIGDQEVGGVPRPRRSHAPRPVQDDPAADRRMGPLGVQPGVDTAAGDAVRFSDIPKALRHEMHALVEEREKLAAYFRRRGVGTDDALMLAHDSIVEAVKHMVRGTEPNKGWRTYTYGIAHNLLSQHWYQRGRDRLLFTDSDEDLVLACDARAVWQDLDGDLDNLPALFTMCIGVLSKYQLKVLYLQFVADMDYREIAPLLGKTEEAVRQCHSDALKKIRSKRGLMTRIKLTYRRRITPYDPDNASWKKQK